RTRYGLLFVNLVFNFVHLLIWFSLIWLVLQLQWPHALLFALVMWLATLLFVWPGLQTRVGAYRTYSPAAAPIGGQQETSAFIILEPGFLARAAPEPARLIAGDVCACDTGRR